MTRNHIADPHMPRYRPVGLSARRRRGHSSSAYGARALTMQSGQRAVTLWAGGDFSPGRHKPFLKYNKYDCVEFPPSDQKITGSGTNGD